MRIQDPFFFPFKHLQQTTSTKKESNIAWFYLLNKLLNLSQNSILTRVIIESCPFDLEKKIDESIKLFNDFDKRNYLFSLDERVSRTHLTPFHLSFFFEPKDSSKQKGQFFTPSYISEFIISKSLELISSSESNLEQQIFGDIACGTGNLLLPLLQQLISLFSQELSPKEHLDFISNNLFGFDTDPISLWISKTRILLFLLKEIPDFSPVDIKLNLYQSDALKALKIKKKRIEESFFDVIVLNPPYMNYGLRNAQKYDKEFRNFLRNRFYSAEYKLSLYPIFIERSIELLREEGILGIITPDSFLLGRFYSKIRSYLLQNTNILDLSLLGFEPFSRATLGRPTITILRKTKDSKKPSFPVRWIPSQTAFQDEIWEEFQNQQKNFSSNAYNRFQIFFNKEDKQFVKDWKELSSNRIQDIVTIHTGVRSKLGQKNIISKSKRDSTWKKGIISSSQVKPFFIDYQNHWINIDPSLLWSGGFDEEVNENPKLIMRQTGYKIITAVDQDGYYHLNNCHSISPKEENLNLFSLSVILNSKEFNQIYQILSIEKGRALAQIDIEFFLRMQIPSLNEDDITRFEKFYFIMNQAAKKGDSSTAFSLFELWEKT